MRFPTHPAPCVRVGHWKYYTHTISGHLWKQRCKWLALQHTKILWQGQGSVLQSSRQLPEPWSHVFYINSSLLHYTTLINHQNRPILCTEAEALWKRQHMLMWGLCRQGEVNVVQKMPELRMPNFGAFDFAILKLWYFFFWWAIDIKGT